MWVRDDDGTEVKLAFSGDIGPGNRPLIKDPEYIKDADYVIMESTYGDRKHNTPPDFAIALAKVIKETLYERGGNLVVPAFPWAEHRRCFILSAGSRVSICCRNLKILRYT